MMNDKFSADLRRHMLETADERPADGQLATVIAAVDATGQRHPILARWTWNPGRVGLVPSAALRFGLVVLALALAMAAGALLAGGGGRTPSTVFEGSWIAIDPLDRSGMTLVIGPGTRPPIYFEDGWATGGACDDDVVKRFTARGTAAIAGNMLVADFPDGGGCGLMTVEVRGIYEYIERTDMLVDQDGLGWDRALGADRVPTGTTFEPRPSPSRAADATPDATPDECLDPCSAAPTRRPPTA